MRAPRLSDCCCVTSEGGPPPLAHVLVAKYCDHLPLYRQSQIFARHGVEIDRSTLANWVGGACWWLEALQARLAAHVFGSTKLFADDTPIPVLDPGRRRTKTGPALGIRPR
jgi:transposase